MLEKLPNEILVNILNKTRSQTIRECRLLNSRFNNIIERFELHKVLLESVSLDTSGQQFIISISKTNRFFPHWKIFVLYEGLAASLNRILQNKARIVNYIDLNNLQINDSLVDVLVNQKSIRTLKTVRIRNCDFVCESTDKWFAFMSKVRINSLYVSKLGTIKTIIPLPSTILSNIEKHFIYEISDKTGAPVEVPWLNDKVLEEWYTHGKLLVTNVKATWTIEGIKRCLKKIIASEKGSRLECKLVTNETSVSDIEAELNEIEELIKAEDKWRTYFSIDITHNFITINCGKHDKSSETPKDE